MKTNIAIIEQVTSTLAEDGFNDYAETLQNAYKNEDYEEVIGLCHSRSLGDLNIKSVSMNGWLSMLDKLEKHVKKKLDK